MTAAGVTADLPTDPDLTAVSKESESALAWALREAITNVVRHSGAQRCVVELVRRQTLDGPMLELSVEDNGTGGSGKGPGNGLTGLGERLAKAGGSLEAARLKHGFRLVARVPAEAPAAVTDVGSPAMSRTIKVLLAEDQSMVREALAALLGLEDDIEVVAQVARGDEVLAAVRQHAVDVALLDIEMPGCTGIEAAAQLHKALPEVKLVVLTTFGRPGYLRSAMEAGADAFLVKDAPAAQLAEAVRKVLAGERVIDPTLAAAALAEGANPLTDREREVLRAAADGSTNAELAKALHLSQGTVRNYLSTAIQKLAVRNRAEAVRIAREKGWL